jgi:hypothetical protein
VVAVLVHHLRLAAYYSSPHAHSNGAEVTKAIVRTGLGSTHAARVYATSENTQNANFALSAFSEVRAEPSRRAPVLPTLPTAFFVFEPVLVLLAVGHGGAFE